MSIIVPESHRDLLEKAYVITLSTVSAAGKPYTSVVWRKWDGTHILAIAGSKSVKVRNIQANPHVSLVNIDPQDGGRYIELRGTAEIIREGVFDVLNDLSMMYVGKAPYYGEVEPEVNSISYDPVIVRVTPMRLVRFPE